jgi:recombination protein RecT
MSQKTNDKIKAELVAQDEAKKEPTLKDELALMRNEIERALPMRMDPDRFARIVLTTVKASPKLLECTKSSIIAGCMLAAQLGLEPGPLGHSYLVPYWNKNIRQDEAQLQIGYKGVIDLARRSGQIKDIEARTVFDGDHFEEEYGLNPKLLHKPNRDNRGEPMLYYLIVRFMTGGAYVRVEDKAKIESHRKRSKASDNGPWKTDYEAMCWKTLVQMSKPWLPLTAEAAAGMALDGAVVNDVVPDMVDDEAAKRQDVIDIDESETSEEVVEPEPDDTDPGRAF